VIRSIRYLGAALGGLTGVVLILQHLADFGDGAGAVVLEAAWILSWTVLGYSLLPYLTFIPAMALLRSVQRLSTLEFVTAIVGLFLGLVLGLLLGLPVAALPAPLGTVAPLTVSVVFGLTMVGLTVAKRHDLLQAAAGMGLLRRDSLGDGNAGPRILVDTSAIIDGRIADISDSGFLVGTLVVPRFVLDELQRLADSSDHLRRTRGRRGLEILGRMRKGGVVAVEISDEDATGVNEVDAKLVELARREPRPILTNDLNLNKVAELQGVRVMNVNSLANAVKPAMLPGEDLHVRIIQPGKDPGQGVGYLDDGTMVVVEGAAKAVDSELDVTVTRVIQTVAGRMIFAHRPPG
jgi:uncharacterized protein YacL